MGNKALLVGINKYKIADSDLSGCVNDATNVRDVLLKYLGFEIGDIRLITDERATKDAIIEGLKWLVKGAKVKDRLLFHFSGHGSQVRDLNGDELSDRLDEILCPHDMDWNGTYIKDDDLEKIFRGLPKGINLEVLLDSCHSGTGTREAFGIKSLPVELSFRPRFLEPPVDVQCRMDEDLRAKKILRETNPLNHVLFSACRDHQKSADAFINGSYNGAFTYYFCKHIRDAEGKATRLELLRRVRASLRFNGFSQVPELEAPKDEKGKRVLE